MIRLLLYWVISVVAVVVAAGVCQMLQLGFTADWNQPGRLFLGVAVLGLINATVGTLLKILTIPLNCLTFGLIHFFINAFLLWWVGQQDLGFKVTDWLAAIVGSVIIGIIIGLLRKPLSVANK